MSLTATGMEGKPERQPCQTFNGHTKEVWDVIHLRNGQHIITCSRDASLRLWDLKNGLQIGKPWQDGKSRVLTLALSPDGKTVMSGSFDGIIRLWNIKTAKVIAKWAGHSKSVVSICWSRNGQQGVSGSWDGTARMWDVQSGKTILGPIDVGYQCVATVIYSPDKTMIATGGGNEEEQGGGDKVKVWDAKTFKLVTTLKGYTDYVNCLSWTKDGKTLVSGSDEGSIRLWNTHTWEQFAVLMGHHEVAWSIAISVFSQVHRRIVQHNYGTSKIAGPSVCPFDIQTQCTAYHFWEMEGC